MNKILLALIIATAFVAGTIASGTLVEAKQSDSLAPLNKILTIDKVGSGIITATSSSQFIVDFCANNGDSTVPDILIIERNGVLIIFFEIDAHEDGVNCVTVGGGAGDILTADSTESDSVTRSTAVMQARDSATASLT